MKTAEERLKAVMEEITELETLASKDLKNLMLEQKSDTITGVFVAFTLGFCARIRKIAQE